MYINPQYPYRVIIPELNNNYLQARIAVDWCKKNTNNDWDLQFSNDNYTIYWMFKDPCTATEFTLIFG